MDDQVGNNPFAAPQQDAGLRPQPALVRDGDCLIVPKDATLPPRCAMTGEPVEDEPVRFRLAWSPNLGLVKRSLCFQAYLGPAARRDHRRRCAIAFAVFLVKVAMLLAGLVLRMPLFFVGVIGFTLLFGILVDRHVQRFRAVRVADGRAWVRGFGAPFLAGFPVARDGVVSEADG